MRPLTLLLLLTTAAQAQWTLQTSPTTADLRGIHAVSSQVAWASGSHGAVLHTTDGGRHWQLCATPPNAEKLDFRGIQAFDAQTAIIMSSGKGDLSRLYKTTNACKSWTLLFTNPDKEGFWDALVFQDRDFGYLLGDPVHGSFYLAESHDGGKSWTQQRNRGIRADPAAQGAFAASNTSLVAKRGFLMFGSGGSEGAMTYTVKTTAICLDDCPASEANVDGANNGWVRQNVPIGNKSESSGIFSMFTRTGSVDANGEAVSSGHRNVTIAVGGDYAKPDEFAATAAFTTDGDHWFASTTPPHGYRSAVAYNPTTKSWLTVGPNGTDISTDDGRNWRPLKPGPNDAPDADRNWNALSLPFLVGPHGRIGILNAP